MHKVREERGIAKSSAISLVVVSEEQQRLEDNKLQGLGKSDSKGLEASRARGLKEGDAKGLLRDLGRGSAVLDSNNSSDSNYKL